MNDTFFLSVICPVFNEAKFIENILTFFTQAKPDNKELIIIDGGSNDGTIEIIEKWCNKYQNIKLLHNLDKYVPYALNKGISECKGDIIVRLDAHTRYAEDYFLKIIETFQQIDADIVGGPMNAVGETNIQKAIAEATSAKFGIGDSKFHDVNYKGYVDSVYLGAWKKNLFNDIGYFDTKFLRNQDDEFHYRAKSKGKKIYLNPEIKSYYYPRDSFNKLFKQYYQYGLFKPLVLQKIKSETKSRHLVPFLFVIYISICFLFSYNFPLILLPLALYLFLDLLSSFMIKDNLKVKLLSLLVFPILHFSYGLGFFFGLLKRTSMQKNNKQTI